MIPYVFVIEPAHEVRVCSKPATRTAIMKIPAPDYDVTPVPPEPQPREELPFRVGGTLCLPLSGTVPLDTCICCGRPVFRTVKKAVRNPRNPLTWYTRAHVIEIGLCKKHAEDNSIAIALTYSLMGLGLILMIVGAFTFHLPTLLIGVIVALFSGFFRAGKPIWGTGSGTDELCLQGVAETFLAQFPEEEIAASGYGEA